MPRSRPEITRDPRCPPSEHQQTRPATEQRWLAGLPPRGPGHPSLYQAHLAAALQLARHVPPQGQGPPMAGMQLQVPRERQKEPAGQPPSGLPVGQSTSWQVQPGGQSDEAGRGQQGSPAKGWQTRSRIGSTQPTHAARSGRSASGLPRSRPRSGASGRASRGAGAPLHAPILITATSAATSRIGQASSFVLGRSCIANGPAGPARARRPARGA